MRIRSLILIGAVTAPLLAQAPAKGAKSPAPAVSAVDTTQLHKIAGAMTFRSIGPALTSGRVADIAVDPTNKKTWYVATAAGGVWKSVNAGLSFTPIFDDQGSYSIGAITIDPKNPNTIWVGTGENNAQRVVAYGDGVYKSIDGGKSWKNVGLKASEHIGRIVIDPRNSDVAYVAAQGPLSAKGGERGIYKTTDGGKTWTRVLETDDWTGANDIQMDPRNPDVLVASTWQRQRRTCCFVAGGPGSAIHRSVDGGKTWRKVTGGLPSGEELGRIGLSMSPANPNVVYAIIEASNGKGGFFRSRDGGNNWEKMSGFQSGGNYYNEIFADPRDVDRVYGVDMLLQVTTDGGKTFQRAGERLKHVDNHSVWIDPDDTEHLIVGCDGGVYESWDRGKTWRFAANLPVTQFYRVTLDDVQPFYRVFGGAQDNFAMGGPSRTRGNNGIRNSDWFITAVGDGFGSAVDPDDPNIVYAESQFGVLSRFNLKTGDVVGIQPEDAVNGPGFRWNWDSPVLTSTHVKGRLYFAAERLLRSDDRGNHWQVISGDLSRNIDRTKVKMFDRVQGVDAVSRNVSTTLFGNITSVAESPVKPTLLATGSNDGRIGITEDGGATWRTIDHINGIPDTSYVSRVALSRHDANVVYATFNNYLNGDYKPYVMRSADLGRTWVDLTANLPARGAAWAIVEDPVKKDLLFVGTDFGAFATIDGGAHWFQLTGGLPAIQVRDLAIQPRHNDLVLATFGRGFYILDDFSPLRALTPTVLSEKAHLFAARTAYMYPVQSPMGLPGASEQGHGFYVADNPPYGATFHYLVRDTIRSRKDARQAADAEARKKGTDATFPSWEALKAEDREEAPTLLLEVRDAAGRRVRRIATSASVGLHHVTWDLRYQPADPVTGPAYQPDPDNPFTSGPTGPNALPGTYTAQLYSRIDGVLAPLGAAVTVQVVDADPAGAHLATRTPETLAQDLAALELKRQMMALSSAIAEAQGRVSFLRRAIDESANADAALIKQARVVSDALHDADELINGDPTKARRNEHTPPSLAGRLMTAIGNAWDNSIEPMTTDQLAQVDLVRGQFGAVQSAVRKVLDVDLKALFDAADRAGIPWTGGRRP